MASWLSQLLFGDDAQPAASGTFDSAVSGAGSTAQTATTAYRNAQAAFDPSAAAATYGQGAAADFNRQLKLQLRDLSARDVGAGRFNTGFFDEDQGDVIKDLGGKYESAFAQQAVNLAGLKQSQIGQEEQFAENATTNYNDLLSGQLDRQQADINAKRQQRSQLWGDLFKLGGTAVAAFAGGGVKPK